MLKDDSMIKKNPTKLLSKPLRRLTITKSMRICTLELLTETLISFIKRRPTTWKIINSECQKIATDLKTDDRIFKLHRQ